MKTARFYYAALLLALVFSCTSAVYAASEYVPGPHSRAKTMPTALDRYVAKPDPHYRYELVEVNEGKTWKSYILKMVSQQWRTAAEVDKPVWDHWLVILEPEKVEHDTAMLLIWGGDNNTQVPKGSNAILRRVARSTNAISAMIYQVPNERLTFSDDGKSRTEDSIIAYTWDKFLRTGDEEWPLRLPMTKSAVRAMDTIQDFCNTPQGGQHAIENFVVAGGSKRGWATWTTAAVDDRVIGCIPIVIDLLNVVPSFIHHWEVYGFWAPAIADYVTLGVMDWLGTKEYDALMDIVDPYSYRERLTLPKLIVNAACDQFFLPTSSQFYIDDLKGTSLLSYVPNVGHGGCGRDGGNSMVAFFQSILEKQPLPEYSWSFPDEKTIRVETVSKPTKVELWQATNPTARDFRLSKTNPKYTATVLQEQEKGIFEGTVQKPEEGYTAFFIQLTFKGPGKDPLKVSTPVRVIPETPPHQWVAPEHPKGFLSN